MKLKNMKITHISLVRKGANRKSVIYKSADGAGGRNFDVKIIKSELERGMIYGVVYAPDEVDTQGDWTSSAEIEKAAYDFMKSRALNVDRDHNFQPTDAFVAESWIIKEGESLLKGEKVGSWAVGVKLESEELKNAVKNGEISAFSMAGHAEREEVNKGDVKIDSASSEVLRSIFSGLLEAFKKQDREDSKEDKESPKNSNKEVVDGVKNALNKLIDELKEVQKRLEVLEKSSTQNKTIHKNDTLGDIL